MIWFVAFLAWAILVALIIMFFVGVSIINGRDDDNG